MSLEIKYTDETNESNSIIIPTEVSWVRNFLPGELKIVLVSPINSHTITIQFGNKEEYLVATNQLRGISNTITG